MYALYKWSSSVGMGAFNARTIPDMNKISERSLARESSKCKNCIGATSIVVLNAMQFSRKRGIKPTHSPEAAITTLSPRY